MGDISTGYQRELSPPPAAETLAALVAHQHGVVSRKQLRELGHSDSGIDWWVRTRRLHRMHRGVYAVGHTAVTPEGRWMAAVLACGPGAVLSHRSAAALWGIRPASKVPEVTAPRTRRGPSGVRVHRPRNLRPDEWTTLKGIPTTTLPRTLADLADVLSERELGRAIHDAEVEHALADRALNRAASRANGRRGSGRLQRAVGAERDPTRSELERRFVALCEEHGLPQPAVNTRIAGFEVDFAWPERGVVAETDGWTYHRTRQAFEHDRTRDQALTRAGHRVLRFTHRQVESAAADVAATLRAALA